MAKFFLRTKEKDGMASLYLRVERPKLKIRWLICTGINVGVATWRKAETNTKSLIKFFATDEGKKVQDQINKVEGLVSDMFYRGILTKNEDKPIVERAILEVVNADAIKALNDVKKRNREEEEKRLCKIINYYEYFIKGISDGSIRQKRGAKAYKESTISSWKCFGKFLKGYCPSDMTFDQINKKFADGFVNYLEKMGFMPKTVNQQVLCFRRLCNAAAIDEVNTNLISVSVWGEREVKDKEKRAEVALSDNEINALYDMPLRGVREQVRDVWMLGFLSAQRVSDYANYTKGNFKTTPNGVNVIVLQQKKTGNDVVVPIIDERVTEICNKYDYDFPKLTRTVINRYIKEVLQMLSATVPSLGEWVRTQLSMAERRKETKYLDWKKRMDKGEKLHGDDLKRYKEMKAYAVEHGSGELLWKRDFSGEIVKRKWECVSSHTSRRSAVTSLYNSGLFDVRDLMSISGHQTIKNFEGYIKRGSIEQAERIAEKARRAKEIQLKKKA